MITTIALNKVTMGRTDQLVELGLFLNVRQHLATLNSTALCPLTGVTNYLHVSHSHHNGLPTFVF